MSRPSHGDYAWTPPEGYLAVYRVTKSRDVCCQIGGPVLRDGLGTSHGDVVGIHSHDDGVLLSAPPSPDWPLVTEVVVTTADQITLTGGVCREHVGAGAGDDVRCYEHDDGGVLVVAAASDPRVEGGSDER